MPSNHNRQKFEIHIAVVAWSSSYAAVVEEVERRIRTGLGEGGRGDFFQHHSRDPIELQVVNINVKKEGKS